MIVSGSKTSGEDDINAMSFKDKVADPKLLNQMAH